MRKSKMYRKFKTYLLVMLLIAPTISFGWGVTGHRVVGEIAQRHLTKKAKKELKKLIGNESIAYWTNWADFIKSDTTHKWDQASKWHYVNLPGNLNKADFLVELQKITEENLYTQIKAFTAQLKDKSLSIEIRQIALRFLVHFVGDLHQPLHVGREADQGGNRIKVTWFDKETNLHSLWDNALVEFQQYSYTEYANNLDIANESAINSWQSSSLEEWFYESYLLANKVYAAVPANGRLSYKYNYIFQDDLNLQLLKGGIRLAKVLNEALK